MLSSPARVESSFSTPSYVSPPSSFSKTDRGVLCSGISPATLLQTRSCLHSSFEGRRFHTANVIRRSSYVLPLPGERLDWRFKRLPRCKNEEISVTCHGCVILIQNQ